ncbi:transcriptional regulator [Nesterenkonia sp. AN1]|uniref:LytR family transcriptional attenuator n=1 Tax=Nesterenkonia aurantiaca TaxID=1436010 RepID=A0A4R7G501_9MICC|nr:MULTISPECIES: LCP family protein [Nesterenkonia]EXF24365.1 transcriptional regulator [Nesterenkonia sp. AN1]TDS86467.1 LytR family transcriptional attenuator [Nesterenkonia aurantiaca]
MSDSTISYHRFTTEPEVIRSPQRGSETDRTRRALMLLALTLFIPGAAQIAAGSKKLGRAALAVTIGCWFSALLLGLMFLTMRGVVLSLLTQPFMLWLSAVVLGALALGWLILWLDTFRLLHFTSLAQGLKPIVAVVLVVLITVTSGALGYGAKLVNEGRAALDGIFASGPGIDAVDGRYNFLLMGADAGEGREGLRPDSIHVVSVNEDSAETIIFSIPRNFQNAQFNEDSPLNAVYPTGYDCGDECIINFLYTDVMNNHQDLYPEAEDPGAEAMMDAVSGSLNLEVSGYVMVDMDGFEQLIDAMGGVSVDSGGWVPYRGPMPDGSWGDNWWAPGVYEFSGQEALAYARSRTFSSDYNRIQRQQCIQQAMMSQFNPQTLLSRFSEIMQAGGNVVETNLPQSQLGSFLDLAVDAQGQTPQRLVLGAPDFGASGDLFSTYPDFEQIQQRVDELIANEEHQNGGGLFGSAGFLPAQSGTLGVMLATPAQATGQAAGAVEDDEPSIDPTSPPTQPDGSELTREYLIDAQRNGQTGVLEEAASSNYRCDPVN